MIEGPGHDSPETVPFGPEAPRRHRGLDRAIGIVLGILLGVGIVTAFVFLGSEETIDAPRIDHGAADGGDHASREKQRQQEPKPVPIVRVVGGAPPPSGPPRLDFKKGETVRFRVETDTPLGIEVPGYGVSRAVESAATLSFPATRVGQFPVIVDFSHIAIATLWIRR
ncbi:MAG: hypothetical protein ACXWZM_01460 [Solirubrobacterales bacterium]